MSPWDRRLYPPDWPAIVARIRERAGGRCECHGQCGLHPGRRCVERQGQPAVWARGKVMLTTAHLNHDPSDNRPENLAQMCQRCHLRLDVQQHRRNAAATRWRKRGNLELDLG